MMQWEARGLIYWTVPGCTRCKATRELHTAWSRLASISLVCRLPPAAGARGRVQDATEEVADGAAVLVDPLDVVSITDGVRVAAADSDRWSQRSLERAGQLTWDRTVAATVDAYREVAR